MGTLPSWDDHPNLRLIYGYESAQTQSVTALAKLIEEYDLTSEMVPTAMLKEKEVWKALSKRMPLTALLRNLATLTRVGVIAPMQSKWVCQRLINGIGGSHGQAGQPGEGYGGGQEAGAGGSRPGIHPIAILSALLTYRAGKGARGKHTCTPVPQVMDALDLVSGRSFNHAPQTNKRLYLGIDVSGSMAKGEVAGVPGLSPRMAAAAMAMVIARREPNYYMAGFAGGNNNWSAINAHMEPLSITASDSISDAMQKTKDLPFGRTDCALPMLHAMEMKMNVDCFIILTDSETWVGNIHPVEALRRYRAQSGIPAKLVVVGMVSNEFTIADPDDAGMMDVVGFDSAVPELITDFAQTTLDAETREGIKRGLQSLAENGSRPWSEVRDELGLTETETENIGYTEDF